jgi:hypothetical protein
MACNVRKYIPEEALIAINTVYRDKDDNYVS